MFFWHSFPKLTSVVKLLFFCFLLFTGPSFHINEKSSNCSWSFESRSHMNQDPFNIRHNVLWMQNHFLCKNGFYLLYQWGSSTIGRCRVHQQQILEKKRIIDSRCPSPWDCYHCLPPAFCRYILHWNTFHLLKARRALITCILTLFLIWFLQKWKYRASSLIYKETIKMQTYFHSHRPFKSHMEVMHFYNWRNHTEHCNSCNSFVLCRGSRSGAAFQIKLPLMPMGSPSMQFHIQVLPNYQCFLPVIFSSLSMWMR